MERSNSKLQIRRVLFFLKEVSPRFTNTTNFH